MIRLYFQNPFLLLFQKTDLTEKIAKRVLKFDEAETDFSWIRCPYIQMAAAKIKPLVLCGCRFPGIFLCVLRNILEYF